MSAYNPGVAGTVQRLETAFAEWLGVQGTVATGYGRSALWLALELVIGGKPGAEVLVPDFICAQVPEAVRRAGGTPVFFPVRRDLTVNEQELEAAITRQTQAVVLAHYYGRGLGNIERLAEMCRRRSVVVIEDCALALGARVNGRLAGRFGDLAVFSFTKSDWCYGGGLLATPVRDWVERLRRLRDEKCSPAARLAFCYGMLRRVDFAANSPRWSRAAGWGGRWMEHGLSYLEPELRGNFFDAGRFDAQMPKFAARRALRILSQLDTTIARHRASFEDASARLRRRLREAGSDDGLQTFRTETDAGDTGAFLLLTAPDGLAAKWLERADAARCTVRLSWPAYQGRAGDPGGNSEWFGRHLLVVETP